jgi:manganese transport protein
MSEAALGTVTARTVAAGQAVLAGHRRGLGAMLPFVGPAVVASIAYMDPASATPCSGSC